MCGSFHVKTYVKMNIHGVEDEHVTECDGFIFLALNFKRKNNV